MEQFNDHYLCKIKMHGIHELDTISTFSNTEEYTIALQLAKKLDKHFYNSNIICSESKRLWEWNENSINNGEYTKTIHDFVIDNLPSYYQSEVDIQDDGHHRRIFIWLNNSITNRDLYLLTLPNLESNIVFKGNYKFPEFVVASDFEYGDVFDVSNLKIYPYQ
jgi:hypothetical protein